MGKAAPQQGFFHLFSHLRGVLTHPPPPVLMASQGEGSEMSQESNPEIQLVSQVTHSGCNPHVGKLPGFNGDSDVQTFIKAISNIENHL